MEDPLPTVEEVDVVVAVDEMVVVVAVEEATTTHVITVLLRFALTTP